MRKRTIVLGITAVRFPEHSSLNHIPIARCRILNVCFFIFRLPSLRNGIMPSYKESNGIFNLGFQLESHDTPVNNPRYRHYLYTVHWLPRVPNQSAWGLFVCLFSFASLISKLDWINFLLLGWELWFLFLSKVSYVVVPPLTLHATHRTPLLRAFSWSPCFRPKPTSSLHDTHTHTASSIHYSNSQKATKETLNSHRID